MKKNRPPAVAGTFYPADKMVLSNDIDKMLKNASTDALKNPKAMLVPHAGYIYSGYIAALAYAHLKENRDTIRRVVVLGPSHQVGFSGIAVPDADAFETPLGEIPIDKTLIAQLLEMNQVVINNEAHEHEHSIEVQLPFLQAMLNSFKLIPLAVGSARAIDVAKVIENVWDGSETLIVVSSDLSHYLPYELAQAMDLVTVENIKSFKMLKNHQQACGNEIINGLIIAAEHHHLIPDVLDFCNSGDTAGNKKRVVGYASILFSEEETC